MAHQNTVVAVVLGAFLFAVSAEDSSRPHELGELKPDYYDEIQQQIDEKFKNIYEMLNLSNDVPVDDGEERYPEVVEGNCAYFTKVYTPYTLKSNNTIHTIVQSSYYKQQFRTAECSRRSSDIGENSVCFQEINIKGNGHCETQYTSLAVYVYNKGTRGLSVSLYRYPSLVPVSSTIES